MKNSVEEFTMSLPLAMRPAGTAVPGEGDHKKPEEGNEPPAPPVPPAPPAPPVPPANPPAPPAPPAPPLTDDPFGNIFTPAEPGQPGADDNEPMAQFVKAFGLLLPEGKEKWEPETVIAQTQAQIEASKQKLDLTQYDPEIGVLFDFVQNNGGSLMGLLVDPEIKALNELTLWDPESFFRLDMGRKYAENGFAEEEIGPLLDARIAKIEEEDREEYFTAYQTKTIKEVINPAIAERVTVLNKDKTAYREKLKTMELTAKTAVVDSMVKAAEQLDNFVGIPILQKNKEAIVSKIKSGDITKEIEKDPGGYQLLGYLVKTIGPSAVEIWKDIVKNQSASQHYKGVKSTLDIVYNSNPGDGSGSDGDKPTINDWTRFKSLMKS